MSAPESDGGKELKTQTGIIGFFDILGYSSFLENNPPQDAAKIVVENLDALREKVSAAYEKHFSEGSVVTIVRKKLQRMHWLVFSDTVLLALPHEENSSSEDMELDWVLFVLNAIVLYRHMFDNGLPLRGAIAFGEFFITGNCFAGRPIIEAYRVGHSLDLSATVIGPSAVAQLERLQKKLPDLSVVKFFRKYLVPLKGGQKEKLMVVPPSIGKMDESTSRDVRQAVAECFWKHNKDVSPAELSKLENTELYLRFFAMQMPHMFRKGGKA